MADIKNPERPGFESSSDDASHEGFRGQAHEAADKTREAAAAARDRVAEQAYSYADQGKQRLTDAIHDVAVSIREAGHKLHEEDQEGPASYVDRTADQVERMARYLEQRDVEQLYESIEDTARRHPAAFIGATFAVGMLAARFVRSSASQRSRRQGQRSQRQYQPGGSGVPSGVSGQTFGGASGGGPSATSPSPTAPSSTAGPYPPASPGSSPSSPRAGGSQPPTGLPSEGGQQR